MKIVVHTLCWNEQKMLPYFLRHYETIADKIVIYDNYSTDESTKIIKAHPKTELNFFDSGNESREDIEIEVKNNCWKANKDADWVIVVDMDELIYHHDGVRSYLKKCEERGVTLPQPKGFDMVWRTFPTTNGQIYDEVNTGVHKPKYDKLAVFKPSEVTEINYGPGCHPHNKYEPEGNIVHEKVGGFKLLHFKLLGMEYIMTRYKAYADRKSEYDKSRGYGHVYFKPRNTVEHGFERDLGRAQIVV